MWPWRKRPQVDGGSAEEGSDATSSRPAKRARPAGQSIDEKMKDVHDVQLELQNLEERCADDQITIQLKYDEMRKPHFQKRGKLLRQIEGFWKGALCGHPLRLTHTAELEALGHLQDLEVRENLDRYGSYEVHATFHDNDLFKEKSIVKKVTYHDVTGERIEAAVLTGASDSGRHVLDTVRSAERSVLGWFLASEPAQPGAAAEDFADVLRRDLWQDPVPYYLSLRDSAAAAPAAVQSGSGAASASMSCVGSGCCAPTASVVQAADAGVAGAT